MNIICLWLTCKHVYFNLVFNYSHNMKFVALLWAFLFAIDINRHHIDSLFTYSLMSCPSLVVPKYSLEIFTSVDIFAIIYLFSSKGKVQTSSTVTHY